MTSVKQAERVAQARRLADGAISVHFQATGETFVCLNIVDKLDTSRASRLSRGAAHRLVDAMPDADAARKRFYHQLIDKA